MQRQMQVNIREENKRCPSYTVMAKLPQQAILRKEKKRLRLDKVLALRRPAVSKAVHLPKGI
jgi:hypothetical protein